MRAIDRHTRPGRQSEPIRRPAIPVARSTGTRGPLDAGGLLWLQRMAGNQATTAVVQRIEETHPWLLAMGEGNRARVMKENAGASEWLTKIGDFFVRKGFSVHPSKGNVMAFLKDGTMAEAKSDAESFGMTLEGKKAKNMHSSLDAILYTDTTLKMNLRPFSASSKDTIAVVEFMVGNCRFEFKYTNNAEAIAAGHYSTPAPTTTTSTGDQSK